MHNGAGTEPSSADHPTPDEDGIFTGEHGYRYRLLDGQMMPTYLTPERYTAMRTLPMRSSDIVYVSYPKSGTTWLSYILVLLTSPASTTTGGSTLDDSVAYPEHGFDPTALAALPSPRLLKSHMPASMAPGGASPSGAAPRYIYIARNPKDVAASYYTFEHGKSWSGYTGPWAHWAAAFAAGRVQRGDWFAHVLGWWERRGEEEVLFLRFEDLKRDPAAEVRKIAEFIGVGVGEERVEEVVRATGFGAMKKSEFVGFGVGKSDELNQFFRKGEVGNWKEWFTVAQSEAFDRLYEERMAGTGLEFEFE